MNVISKGFLVLMLFPVQFAVNAQTKTWSRTISFTTVSSADKNDFVAAVIPSPSLFNPGGYLIAGSSNSFCCGSSDVWVMTLNENGSIGQKNRYDTGQRDLISWIEKTDGGYVLTGMSFRGGSQDAWIMKIDLSGNIVWQKFIGSDDPDLFSRIKQTPDHGFIVLGASASTPSKHWAVWIVKFSASGEIVWQKSYDSGFYAGYYSLALAPGGFIIAGPNFSVIRFDDSGNILWAKSYGGPKYDQASAIVRAPQEGFILTGSTVSFGRGSRNLWILRIDSAGKILWQKVIGLRSVQDGQSIIRTNNGGNIIAGKIDSSGNGGFDGFLVKIDQSGNVQWQRTYGGLLADSFTSVRPTRDRGYVAAGYTKSFQATKFDGWVLKLDENGLLATCADVAKSVFIPAENSNAVATDRTRSELPVSTRILDTQFVKFELDAAFSKNNCVPMN